jgi:O-acetyl-ADP-ribose deacetylase
MKKTRYALSLATDLVLVQADITTLPVDAIVTAANATLLGGGGVDGAIHKAAGPELLAACKAIPEVRAGTRCLTGRAVITPGFALPAKSVIHTVGPVYDSHPNPVTALTRCYRSCLQLARTEGYTTMAFPALFCGEHGYPIQEAAVLALQTVQAYGHELREVWFSLFTEEDFEVFDTAARQLD